MNGAPSSHLVQPDTCSTCVFKRREDDGNLFCRRNPPTLVAIKALIPVRSKGNQPTGHVVEELQAMLSVFPKVEAHWWCGRYSKISFRSSAEAN